MNLSQTIIPKSDQLNADDLIAGARTIRITDVRAGNAEQPVCIHFEGDAGRPYKPGKSMRRVLVAIWGEDSAAYIGRRLTIYRDASVRFGNDETGGIRISHASHINGPQTMALTVTRGKRKPYRVDPLPEEKAAPAATVDVQSLTDVGDTKAREGNDALRAWWQSLPAAARVALKEKLDAWKQTAESVGAGASAGEGRNAA